MISLKKYLQRSTQTTSFIPEIDGLRFFAIITVVIFHLNTAYSRQLGMDDLALNLLGGKENILAPGWWIVRLDLGVKVFFAISGFVLALPFLKHYLAGGKKVEIGEYFYRRLTRLEPPFVITLIFFTFVHHFIFHKSWTELNPHFWAGILYSHVAVFGAPSPINPVTWSLETEAQFYLLVPALFAIVFMIRNQLLRMSVLFILFLTSIGVKAITFNAYPHVSSSILAYFSHFLVGIIVAWFFLKHRNYFSARHRLWDLYGLIFLFMLFYFYKPQNDFWKNVVFNAAILGFILAAFKGRLFNWFFTSVPVYLIGGMCYTIYLLHFAFFHLMVKFTGELTTGAGYLPDLALQFLLIVPAVLMLSILFFVLVEKPCMDKHWPKKLSAFLFRKTTYVGS